MTVCSGRLVYVVCLSRAAKRTNNINRKIPQKARPEIVALLLKSPSWALHPVLSCGCGCEREREPESVRTDADRKSVHTVLCGSTSASSVSSKPSSVCRVIECSSTDPAPREKPAHSGGQIDES